MRCARHRGPDEPGTWHDGDLVFGFNRLSIIDIEHSHQPLRWGPPESPDRYALVFNGEIYNYLELRDELAEPARRGVRHRGRRRGHRRRLPPLGRGGGAPAARHVRVRDLGHRERELFGARDPFGIKPLFMATGAGRHRRRQREEVPAGPGCRSRASDVGIDQRALQHYMVLQYVPEPDTLHRGVRRLESGQLRHARPGRGAGVDPVLPADVRRGAVRAGAGAEQRRYDEITAVLEDSVAKHMRADVTVGSFLSGGIDSTAIAALAMRHNPRPDHLHHRLRAGGLLRGRRRRRVGRGDRRPACRRRWSARRSSPRRCPRSSGTWTIRSPTRRWCRCTSSPSEARKHVKVVLSGEGADELFGGYTIYREPLSLERLRLSSRGAARAAGRGRPSRCRTGMRGKSLLHRGSLTSRSATTATPASSATRSCARCCPTSARSGPTATSPPPVYAQSAGWDPVARMQHIDLFTWLRGDILVKADKMTMANSLELRVPFLDPEVFAVAARLPLEQKITRDTTKYALRRALEPHRARRTC